MLAIQNSVKTLFEALSYDCPRQFDSRIMFSFRQRRRPGVEFGGRKIFSRTKIPFSRRKFLMTFFSHRPGSSDFTFFTVIKCHIRPFLHKKYHYFRKEFLHKTIFLLFSSFRAHPTTVLL